MNAMMGGTHFHTPQTIFGHMMGGQQHPQDVPQWMQMPQVPPISMPWAVSSSQQNIVRFGEDRPQPSLSCLHQKRKLDPVEMIDTRQHKQFITEEKMAAHFQDLHISTKPPAEPVPSTSTAVVPVDVNTKLEVPEVCKNSPRLVISDELKRLRNEPILPSSLLSKLERPTMALVLWEPRNKHLRYFSGSSSDTPSATSTADDDDNNNNNSTVSDHNVAGDEIVAEMTTDVEDVVLEPMDL